MNPPDLLLFADFGGDWEAYEDELNRVFLAEIARARLLFRGLPVNCRRIPERAGRWAAFWHLVQQGSIEEERVPDLRRCERLRWVPWVIRNSDAHPDIGEWDNTRGTETNRLLWYREEYLVILGKRSGYWLLKSAYCTEQSGRIAKLRRERDAFRRASAMTSPKS
jgi:hypothetical protein